MDIPVKLETTLKNLHLLDNKSNEKLIYEFYLYLRSVNTSETYQNQNIKALINMAKFSGKDVDFTNISKKRRDLALSQYKS